MEKNLSKCQDELGERERERERERESWEPTNKKRKS